MELKYLMFLTVLGAVTAGKHDIYEGYSVHDIQLLSTSDQKLLSELEEQLELDVWEHGMPGQRAARVMVTPERRTQLLDTLDQMGIEHYVHLTNVPEALEKFDEEQRIWSSSRSNRMIFDDFQRYSEIDRYIEVIAERHPNLVNVVTAGQSFEGRDIKYLKISTTNFNDPSKPIYFMNAMIHAREWVTTPVTLYSIYRLVENLRHEDADLLQDVDWIIMPLVNPDGYEYTHTDERLWRKTRSFYPEVNATCYGVDGNRNFDILFNTLGVSANPCAFTYPGHVAFSEPETQYIRDILQEYRDRIQIYMDIHSHGNYILFGYGDASLTSNAAQLHQVGAAMGAAIDAKKLDKARYYLVGNSASVLYATSGSAQDYGQFVGVPFSYTLELPGYEYSFQVPARYQDQINEETWHGIAASARLAKLYYASRYTPATPPVNPPVNPSQG